MKFICHACSASIPAPDNLPRGTVYNPDPSDPRLAAWFEHLKVCEGSEGRDAKSRAEAVARIERARVVCGASLDPDFELAKDIFVKLVTNNHIFGADAERVIPVIFTVLKEHKK